MGDEGEICIDLSDRPTGLMQGYLDDAERTAAIMHDGFYHTGDVASRDADGYLTYVGRTDDVFKSSDYRISPFELESVLIEHAAVAEAAVVPSPDALRLAVPKAFVVLVEGHPPDANTALSIFKHVNERVSPYKRIRRLEFAALPKTISGKIRRVELRNAEHARSAGETRRPQEFWEEDLRSPQVAARLKSHGRRISCQRVTPSPRSARWPTGSVRPWMTSAVRFPAMMASPCCSARPPMIFRHSARRCNQSAGTQSAG